MNTRHASAITILHIFKLEKKRKTNERLQTTIITSANITKLKHQSTNIDQLC